jgi:hypothetical protein
VGQAADRRHPLARRTTLAAPGWWTTAEVGIVTDDDRDWPPWAKADFGEEVEQHPEPVHRAKHLVDRTRQGFLGRHPALDGLIYNAGVVGLVAGILALLVVPIVLPSGFWSDLATGLLLLATGVWMITDARAYSREYRRTTGPVLTAEVVSVRRLGDSDGFDCVVRVNKGEGMLEDCYLHTRERRPKGTIEVARTRGRSLIWVDPWERRLHLWGFGGLGLAIATVGAAMLVGWVSA